MDTTGFIDGSRIADKPFVIAQPLPAARLISTLLVLLSLVPGLQSAEIAAESPHEKDEFKGAKQRAPGAPTTHWSFHTVRLPHVPTGIGSNRTAGSSAPIDAFVATKLGEKSPGLRRAADRRTLIRRVYFDLLGLPPAPEEVDAFVSDAHPRAYEQLVDRLLASPHYGERWGRHWLDVAGFAESSMFIGDVPRQGFWRYRDYVVRAFNEDKPYDRFIIEQLAGDELFDWRNAETFSDSQINLLAATGFLRCTPDATDNQAITQMDKRHIAQQAAVEVSMKALMGLTINCVRCHDHKFDPITQEEYYRLIAVFQPAYDPENWLPGIWSAPYVGSLRAIPLLPRKDRQELMRESLEWFAEYQALNRQVRGGLEREYRDRWMKQNPERFTNETTLKLLAALEQTLDDRGTDGEKQLSAEAQRLELTGERLRELFPEFARRHAAATNRVEELKKANTRFKEDVIWCLFDATTNPSSTRLLKRGNYETPGQVVEPGVIAVIDKPERSARFNQAPGEWTTGRRLALARWLVHPGHPLVARVMVNRIWQHHFGVGLVSTPDDFGARGSPPASQELLDWMASEFVANEWSVKHLHRLIMNSATYRQETLQASDRVPNSMTVTKDGTGKATPESIAAFVPGPRRLEAEAIRDSMLETSGLLDRQMFGPSIPTERRPDGSFDVKAGHSDRRRRSIYISTRRTYVPTVLTLFDEPQMDSNWPKRSTSAIAQQALALMNDGFVIECASAFASRVKTEGGDTFSGRLARAFALAYQRAPTPEETAEFQKSTADVENPWPFICQALLSSSEYLYVD